ncbi:MAG: response regulator [Candidatus Rokuibacteriota bacterium]|jgi:two-component system copper resistance phosphate regulon response regulator CusR
MATFGLHGDAETEGRDRLLLVDPYGTSREGLGAALRGGGFAVETAASSSEAIRKADQGAFDLAIIDLDLPPVHGIAEDGWDLVRILRAADPGLLMVLIAAECHPDTRVEAQRYGAAHLLEKPISPRELRSIVRNLRPETTPV